MQEKIVNQRKNFLHHKSKALVSTFAAVVIEYLDKKGMSEALNFLKIRADNGCGMFTSFSQYKLTEQRKQLIKIDKLFSSTKTCSSCGITQPMRWKLGYTFVRGVGQTSIEIIMQHAI